MMVTALIMGFAGSLHCIGMCSPLAMAATHLGPKVVVQRIIYNSGRIFTYGLLGVAVGVIGWMLPLENFQNFLSIGLGVSLLIMALVGGSKIRVPYFHRPLQKVSSMLKGIFSTYLKKRTLPALFLLGILNGLLPCGLTFLALTYTLTLGNPIASFNFMLLFGLGTLPAMLGFTTVLHWIVATFHINLKRLTTSMLLISGCLLIMRVLFFHSMHSPEEQHLVDIVLCR